MKPIQVSPAAHAAVRAASAAAGVSMSAWASNALLDWSETPRERGVADPHIGGMDIILPTFLEVPEAEWRRVKQVASARSQTPAETLSAALDTLGAVPAGYALEPLPNALWDRLCRVGGSRGQSAEQTLTAALDALGATGAEYDPEEFRTVLCGECDEEMAFALFNGVLRVTPCQCFQRPAIPDRHLAPWERK